MMTCGYFRMFQSREGGRVGSGSTGATSITLEGSSSALHTAFPCYSRLRLTFNQVCQEQRPVFCDGPRCMYYFSVSRIAPVDLICHSDRPTRRPFRAQRFRPRRPACRRSQGARWHADQSFRRPENDVDKRCDEPVDWAGAVVWGRWS